MWLYLHDLKIGTSYSFKNIFLQNNVSRRNGIVHFKQDGLLTNNKQNSQLIRKISTKNKFENIVL